MKKKAKDLVRYFLLIPIIICFALPNLSLALSNNWPERGSTVNTKDLGDTSEELVPIILPSEAQQNGVGHESLDETLQMLGVRLPKGDLPTVDHLPRDVSSQAFEAGVRLARKPYKPKKTYETLVEAIIESESHEPEIAEEMARNILHLFYRLYAHGKQLEEKLSREEFELLLEKNQIFVEIPNVGSAHLNTVDGVKWANIRIEGSNLAIIMEPADRVHIRSKHAQRIIASQHIAGGRSRTDGQRGRDVLKIRYFWKNNELKIESIDYFPRHKTLSIGWLKDFALFTLTPPSLGDVFVLGIPAGLWQAGVAAGFDLVNNGEVNWNVAAFTFFFGGIYCGIFSSNIRRLTNEFTRTDTGRLIANILATSLPYALLYKILYSKEGLAVLNPATLSGILEYVGLSIHFWINNITKSELQGVIGARTLARLNTQTWHLPLTELLSYLHASLNKLLIILPIPQSGVERLKDWFERLERKLGVKRSNIEQTGIYNIISFPARLADLSNFIKIEFSRALNLHLSAGRIWLIGLYPFARWIKILNAEWIEEGLQAQGDSTIHLGAREAREKWNRSLMGFFVGLPVGTLVDSFLAAKSLLFPTRARDQEYKHIIPKGSLFDPLMLIYRILKVRNPEYHLNRIQERWKAHSSKILPTQVERVRSWLSGLGKATRLANNACGENLRRLTERMTGDHHPQF